MWIRNLMPRLQCTKCQNIYISMMGLFFSVKFISRSSWHWWFGLQLPWNEMNAPIAVVLAKGRKPGQLLSTLITWLWHSVTNPIISNGSVATETNSSADVQNELYPQPTIYTETQLGYSCTCLCQLFMLRFLWFWNQISPLLWLSND